MDDQEIITQNIMVLLNEPDYENKIRLYLQNYNKNINFIELYENIKLKVRNDEFNKILLNEEKGDLYIKFNEMYNYYGNNVYKLGRSNNSIRRITDDMSSYIYPTNILYSKNFEYVKLAEQLLFQKLDCCRIVKNREFFRCELDKIIKIIDDVFDIFNTNSIERIIETYFDYKIDKKKKFR